MQKYLLFTVCFLINMAIAVAQITLEHTYERQFVNRYNMPIAGECYIEKVTSNAPTFPFYGSNHVVVRQIPLVGNPNRLRRILDITESPNGGLRYTSFVFDSLGVGTESLSFSDDRGNVLLSVPRNPSVDSFSNVSLIKDIGLNDRLAFTITHRTDFGRSFKMYDLDGNNLKVQAKQRQYSPLVRLNLAISGEKFYQSNHTDSIFFLNADLTPWKKFKIPSAAIFSIAETRVNTTSLIEIVCQKDYLPDTCFAPCSPDSIKLLAINELQQVSSSFDIKNVEIRKIIRDNERIGFIDSKERTKLFTFKNGIRFAKAYPEGMLTWQNLGRFGLKYILAAYNSDTLHIYNEDQSLWKIIVLPMSPNNKLLLNYSLRLHVVENTLNGTSLLNVIFTEYRLNSSNSYDFNVKVVDENGNELLKITDGDQFELSQWAGLQTKLLVWSQKRRWTKVYSFPNITSINTVSEKLTAQVYPNPFDKTLIIKLKEPISFASNMLTIEIFDITGKILLRKNIEATPEITLTEAADLPRGFYLLKINDTENRQAVLKIVKN